MGLDEAPRHAIRRMAPVPLVSQRRFRVGPTGCGGIRGAADDAICDDFSMPSQDPTTIVFWLFPLIHIFIPHIDRRSELTPYVNTFLLYIHVDINPPISVG